MPVPYFNVEVRMEGDGEFYNTWGAYTREDCENHIAHLKDLNESVDNEPERWSPGVRKYAEFRIVETTHHEYVMNPISRVEVEGKLWVRPCCDDYADGPYAGIGEYEFYDLLREHMDIPEGDRMDDSGTIPGTYRVIIERVED